MHRMQFMKRFIVILLCLLPLYAISSNAAETQKNSSNVDKTQQKTSPFQLSFFYPLSIYGINSSQYTFNTSFNILAGYVGGIDGIEFAGLFNVDRHNVKYVQIAGLYNMVLENFKGFQLSGISNVVLENFKGFQLAAVDNISVHHTSGLQLAGVLNYSHDITGLQYAFVSNVTIQHVQGTQFGLLNYAQSVTGSQIGLINYSTNLSGLAFGLINVYPHISDNTLPIGLINIVWGKKGYHAISVSSGLHSIATANIKLGVPHFYTFFGLDEISSKVNYHIGMGTHIPYYFKSLSSSIEVSYIQIQPKTANLHNYNSVLELKGTLEYALPFYPALSPFIAVGVYDSLTPFRLKNTKFDAQLGLLYAF